MCPDSSSYRGSIISDDPNSFKYGELGNILRQWKVSSVVEVIYCSAAVDPENPSTVYINTFNSAAFRSDDRGDSWYRLEGYNFKWGHRPVPDPRHPGMLFLTTFGGSVFYGPAGGVPGAFEDIENLPSQRWQVHPVLELENSVTHFINAE